MFQCRQSLTPILSFFKKTFCFIFLLFFLTSEKVFSGGEGTKSTSEIPLLSLSFESCDFEVEIAKTPETLGRGLMHRLHLESNRGMLFVYPQERLLTMWMKNTWISLDIIFLDSRKRIVCLYHRAVPFKTKLLSCPIPAQYVLEIPGGQAEKNSLNLGSQATFQEDF